LILGHHYHGGFIIALAVVQIYTCNPGWANGFADVNLGVRIPLDDVNLFVVQFAYDCLDADTPLAHTSANRVNTLLCGRNSHLGALTRLAGDRTDLNDAVVNFGNFVLEQPAQEVAMGA